MTTDKDLLGVENCLVEESIHTDGESSLHESLSDYQQMQEPRVGPGENLINCDDVVTQEFPDLTEYFKTEEVFDSKMEVAAWITEIGVTLNCVIVKSYSKIQNMVMQCERSRKYSSHLSKTYVPKTTTKKKIKSGTHKCDCPFKINSSSNKDGKWVILVKCGFHNHPLPKTLTRHSYPGRLNKEEMELVEDLTVSGVNPRGILTSLKAKFLNNHLTMRTIYNARAILNLIACQGRNIMQQFMVLSQDRHYTVEYKYDEKTNEVTDLFFAHPKFVKLAQCFHEFLILDCTFKTNRYKLPLFHMVSHTSTGAIFTVAVAFLSREQEENYVWALECMKRLYRNNEVPFVFVTDREIALINVVAHVFPHGSHLLCTWHIGKAVLSQCQKHYKIKLDQEENKGNTNECKEGEPEIVKSKTLKDINNEKAERRQLMLDNFIDDWHTTTWSQTKKYYEEACKKFILRWEPEYKGMVDYVASTWLKPYKERFVYAWNNEIKHFNNSQRVEWRVHIIS